MHRKLDRSLTSGQTPPPDNGPMGELIKGQSVGSWSSNFGQADLTVQKEIGNGYASREAAAKAAYGQQSVLTQEGDGKFHAYAIDDGAYGDNLNLGERVSLKTGIPNVRVLDVVGEDNYQLVAEQKVLPPIGEDNGKAVYFVRNDGAKTGLSVLMQINNAGYSGLNPESHWDEEIKQIRKKGYTVIVDPRVTESEMRQAFYDPRTAGVVYFGHGSKGLAAIDGDDGKSRVAFEPSSLDSSKVSPHLKFVYWQSCSTNSEQSAWEKVLNGAASYGWKRRVITNEVMAANQPWLYGVLGLATRDGNGGRLDKIIDKHL